MNLGNYPQKSDGRYLLKKPDFEVIGQDVLNRFRPENLIRPMPLDIDGMMYNDLNLDILSMFISQDGSLLGMIAFDDCEWEVYTGSGRRTQAIPMGTVVIDASLSGPEQRPRCRFTKAHEASHWILHRSYHSPDKKTYNFRPAPECIACRQDNIERYRWNYGLSRTEDEWAEWQADSLAAVLLMPKEVFSEKALSLMRSHGIYQSFLLIGERLTESRDVIDELAKTFEVSRRAAQIRMLHLGLIRQSL